MTDFIALGGYGWYVWMSYGAVALVVLVETLAVRARHRRAREVAGGGSATPVAPPAARFDPAPPR